MSNKEIDFNIDVLTFYRNIHELYADEGKLLFNKIMKISHEIMGDDFHLQFLNEEIVELLLAISKLRRDPSRKNLILELAQVKLQIIAIENGFLNEKERISVYRTMLIEARKFLALRKKDLEKQKAQS